MKFDDVLSTLYGSQFLPQHKKKRKTIVTTIFQRLLRELEDKVTELGNIKSEVQDRNTSGNKNESKQHNINSEMARNKVRIAGNPIFLNPLSLVYRSEKQKCQKS